VLVILPFSYLQGSGLLFVWSLISWSLAPLLTLIEFPILQRLLPSGTALAGLANSLRGYMFRCISYALFAVVLGISLVASFSWFVGIAGMFAIAATCYAVALVRGEDNEESVIKFST
jgi:hypothetical protein